MDIDIWVMPSPANAEAVLRALRRFGSPLHGLTVDALQKEDTIFQIGVAIASIVAWRGAMVAGCHNVNCC